ncbi:MAG: cytochrome c-type biogenesis protein [Micropepsaceae bacterium]
MTMRLLRSILLVALAATALATTAFAVEPDEILADPALEARARAITQELRCVVCQNQSIDDSNAPLAKDMRVLVRERVKLGESDDQIRAYLVQRYGNFVLLKPPLQADTLALWFSPLVFLAIGFALVWGYFRAMARQEKASGALNPAEEEELKRLAEES